MKHKTTPQGGRPRALEIGDKRVHRQLRELAKLFTTRAEAAAVIGVSVATLDRFMVADVDAHEAWEQGRGEGRVSLRRAQWQAASKGNPAMLIWLGKQVLTQTDRVEQTVQVVKRIEDMTAEELEFVLEGHRDVVARFEEH